MKDTKCHLCSTCKKQIPTCDSSIETMIFGDGLGNDNVIDCRAYVVDKSKIERLK